MKRLILPVVCLWMLLLACNITTTTTPVVVQPSATEPPVIVPTGTETPTEIPTVPPLPTATSTVTPILANVICQELSLYLDPSLASGYSCETVLASGPDEMLVHPTYTKLTITGYALAGTFFKPQISVFPVQQYSEMRPDVIPDKVAELQTLAAGGPAPSFASSFGSSLPFLPFLGAAEVFFARYQAVPFASGSGIRYLTEFAQYSAPVNNNEIIYTYQGLTGDGKYWVSAILPINHPILPADAKSAMDGVDFNTWSNNFGTYITDMVNKLNTQDPNSFTPTLAVLDALVSSITIQP